MTVLDFAQHGPGFRSVKETVSRAGGDGDCVGFALHGPGFRSVKETVSRAGRKRRLCWALPDTDLDSGLLKRQYHEQEETEIVLALLDTTRIQVC